MASHIGSTRRALASKPLQSSLSNSPQASAFRVSSTSFKRPRSPDPKDIITTQTIKRPRGSATTTGTALPEHPARKGRHVERELQKIEFKEKYTKAFPNWIFHFDVENIDSKSTKIHVLKAQIYELGGRIEDFFSKSITHLVTDQPIPVLGEGIAGKENDPNFKVLSKKAQFLKSPIKLKTRTIEEYGHNKDVTITAASFGVKIWNSSKLESVLSRCLGSAAINDAAVTRLRPLQRSSRDLERLLTKEKIHGPTDRDPTQRRHDFRYFSRGSCFVLVEDMRQEVAPIAIHEYPSSRDRHDKAKSPWPILHCHPQARGPFVAFDEKERQRWQRAQLPKGLKDDEVRRNRIFHTQTAAKPLKTQSHPKITGDLRRSVSLNNLHKQVIQSTGNQGQELDAEGDGLCSANASGFLASRGCTGYMAASGNSIGVTSTTGTTSTSGNILRNAQLPAAIDGRIKKQVITSRKFPSNRNHVEKEGGTMGPPSTVPHRPLLKKSKSTNTLKLPKREEGTKPGYCESCRVKFDDFKTHIASPKHRRFATNSDNFLQLDAILARVQRQSLKEVLDDELKRGECCRKGCKKALRLNR